MRVLFIFSVLLLVCGFFSFGVRAAVTLHLSCNNADCYTEGAVSTAELQGHIISQIQSYFSAKGTTIPSANIVLNNWAIVDGSNYEMSLTFSGQYQQYESDVPLNMNAIFNGNSYIAVNTMEVMGDYISILVGERGSAQLLTVFGQGDDPDIAGSVCADFTVYDALAFCRAEFPEQDIGGVSVSRSVDASDPTLPVRMRSSPGCSVTSLVASSCPNTEAALIAADSATTTCAGGVVYIVCDEHGGATGTSTASPTTTTAVPTVSLSVPSERRGAVTVTRYGATGGICAHSTIGLSFTAQSLCGMAGFATPGAVAYGVVASPPVTYAIKSLDCYKDVATSLDGCSSTSTATCGDGLLTTVRCPLEVVGAGGLRSSATLFTLQGDGAESFAATLFMKDTVARQISVTNLDTGVCSFYFNDPADGLYGPPATALEGMWNEMSEAYIRLVLGGSGTITKTTSTIIPTSAAPSTTPFPFPNPTGNVPTFDTTPIRHNTAGWTFSLLPFYSNNPRKGFFQVTPAGSSGPVYTCNAQYGALGDVEAANLCRTVNMPYSAAKGFVAPPMLSVKGLGGSTIPAITSLTCNASATSKMGDCLFYYNTTVGSVPCDGSQIIALQCGDDVSVSMTAITGKAIPYDEASFKSVVGEQASVNPNRVKVLGVRVDADYIYRNFTIIDTNYTADSSGSLGSFSFPSFSGSMPSGSYSSGAFPSGSGGFPSGTGLGEGVSLPSDFTIPASLQKEEFKVAARGFSESSFPTAAAYVYNETGSGYDMSMAFIAAGRFDVLKTSLDVYELRVSTDAYASIATPPASSTWSYTLSVAGTALSQYSASNAFGRLSLRIGANPLGVADSADVTSATALHLCASVGSTATVGRAIPYSRLPNLTAPIYVSGLQCTGPRSCVGTISDPWGKVGASTHQSDLGLFCGRNVLPEAGLFSVGQNSLMVFADDVMASPSELPSCVAQLLNVDASRFSFSGGGRVSSGGATYMLTLTEGDGVSDITAQDIYIIAMLTNEWALKSRCGGSRFLKGGSDAPVTVTTLSTTTRVTTTSVRTTTTAPVSTVPGQTTTTGQTTAPVSTVPGQTTTTGQTTAPVSTVPGQTTTTGQTTAPVSTVPGQTTTTGQTTAPVSTVPGQTTTTGQTTTVPVSGLTSGATPLTPPPATVSSTTTTTKMPTTPAKPIVAFSVNTSVTINRTAVQEAIALAAEVPVDGVVLVDCPSLDASVVCFEFSSAAAASLAERAANNGAFNALGIMGAAASGNTDAPLDDGSGDGDDSTTVIIVVVVVVVVVVLLAGAGFCLYRQRAARAVKDIDAGDENLYNLLQSEYTGEGNTGAHEEMSTTLN